MLGIDLAFIIISAIVGVTCFLTTSNLYFTLITFVIYVGYFFLYQRKKFKKYKALVRRVHSCCFFINSFVISMSVKNSMEEAYESGLRINDTQLKLYTDQLYELSDYEKVKYLKTYFGLAIYNIFLNILEIYQDQGGNILTMSENLFKECTRTEKTLTDSESIGVKHMLEFMILWGLSFAVLLFMKFGIGEFYDRMLNNSLFAPLILVFFLICLLSIHFFLNSFINLSIKEDKIKWKR